uniref:ATP-binding cassette domain-containing protein n=1 Tax=Enterococcus faecium TaxID=1352 RepID=UPI0016504CDC
MGYEATVASVEESTQNLQVVYLVVLFFHWPILQAIFFFQAEDYAYGAATVVRNVDVRAESGRILGLLGPNGSGKTTLVRMLTGIVTPRSGQVLLDGRPLGSVPH